MAEQKADVRHIQEMLRAAGYDIPLDGQDGPATQEALRQYMARQNTVDAERAKADTAKASADAERAKADAAGQAAQTERIKAETEAKRIAADAIKRHDDATATDSKRAFDSGVTVGAYATGYGVGTYQAAKIEKTFEAGIANKSSELRNVAKELAPLVKRVDAGAGKLKGGVIERTLAKVEAIVKTADTLGLTKVARGPAAPIAAVGFIALGAASRALGANSDNETIKTILNASGTAEIVAGATLGIKDLSSRSAQKVTVDAKALSKVEQARALVDLNKGATAAEAATKAGSLASRVLSGASKVVGKIALPVAAVITTVEAVRGYKENGARGAAEGALNALDPTAIVLEKGLVSRVFDLAFGPGEKSLTSLVTGAAAAPSNISGKRLAAGKQAAAAETLTEKTQSLVMPVAAPQAAAAPAASAMDGHNMQIHHGWTNEARRASQVARGVVVTVPGK